MHIPDEGNYDITKGLSKYQILQASQSKNLNGDNGVTIKDVLANVIKSKFIGLDRERTYITEC